MDLTNFIVTVIIVTASGALAPGPLFFGSLMSGTKHGARAGFSCAIGHMMVEFPLVLALALGLLVAASQPSVRSIIGLVGGIGLIGFGVAQIYSTFKSKPELAEFGDVPKASKMASSSLMVGLAFTGLNPYFILWWLTIGSILIIQALAFAALAGVLLMYAAHVWMDYVYLTAIAHLGKRGRMLINSRYYKFILVVFGLVLIYYGSTFLLNAV